MTLKVHCPECSRKYDVKDSLAGKEFPCRGCGASVAVPRSGRNDDLEEVDELETFDDVEDLQEARPIPSVRSRAPRRPAANGTKKLPARQASSDAKLIVFLVCGGVFALLLCTGLLVTAIIQLGRQRGAIQVPQGQAAVPNAGPVTMPQPPLVLAKPISPGSRLGEIDLNTLDVAELRGAAADFASEGNYHNALLCQHAATTKDNDGQYNLACYYSRVGNLDAALYWIQIAAGEEGVDSDWAQVDSDLLNLRGDSRWPIILAYLRQYNHYWQTSGISETSLVLPTNASADRPLPVLIGLHGMGDNAHNFVDSESYQAFADANQMAVLGVSGTRPKGKKSFVWSEDAGQDLARIDAALKEVSDRLTVEPGRAVLFGFSQGAMMSAEIAARHPDRFAGAIVMSPGGNGDAQISSVRSSGNQSRQGYIVVCGAGEHPGNVALTNRYANDLRGLRARVFIKLYADQDRHTFPSDYYTRLPAWCGFILNPNAPVPAF